MTSSRRVFSLSLACLVCAMFLGSGDSSAAETVKATANPYVLKIDIETPVLSVLVHGKLYRRFPVSLGKSATQTPIGSWRVVDKQRDWGGGFGTRWLGLNVPWGTYGIHGTNRPMSIGQYASNGCIRMLNPDVEQLYSLIPLGTPVIVTGDPLRSLRTLEYGNIGADVQWVQQRLSQVGYYRGSCHGRFDAGMEFSLIFYELSRRLPMDGVVGLDDYQSLGLDPKKLRFSDHH